MQKGLCFYEKEDGAVAQDSNKVYKADGDRDPNVHMLHPGDPNQEEGGDLYLRGIESVHDKLIGKYLFPDLKWHFQHRSVMHFSLLSELLSET